MSGTYGLLTKASAAQVWRYPLRSSLVIMCAALGVACAITAVNYASGGRAQILEQIRRLGTNLVIVSAKQSRAVADRERTGSIVTTLTDQDYRAILDEVTGPVPSTAMVSASLRLKAGYLSTVTTVVGVEPDYFGMKSWPLDAGEFFGEEALRRSSRVALVGHTVVRDLFENESPLGERLFINRVPFEVIGVLAERGAGLDQANEDARVYVPLTAATRRLLNIDSYGTLLFELPDIPTMGTAAWDIESLLRTRHRISAFRPDDFQVLTQAELIRTQQAAADRLGFLVAWISLTVLGVSGLGILAIAWIAVRDRTAEIGTRRALGATAPHIFYQFALEAGLLAGLGVLLGMALSWGASRYLARQMDLPFVFDQANAWLAVMVALILNLAFASGPALRAARMDPIRALKHE